MTQLSSPQFVVPLTRTEFEQIFQSEQALQQRLPAYQATQTADPVCAVVCYHELTPNVEVSWYVCQSSEEFDALMRRAVPYQELRAQQRKKRAAYASQS